MNWKILLVLLILSVGAGLYLAREMGVFKPVEKESPPVAKLMTFQPEDVDRLSISFFDTVYVIRRGLSDWMIESPYPGEMADSMTVNSLLRTLNRITVIKKIPLDSISLAQVMLDHPTLSFRMDFADGSKGGVDFGVINPTTDNIYAHCLDADSVIMFNKILGRTLAVTGQMIRSRQLIEISPYRVNRLVLSTGDKAIFFALDSVSGQWWIESPGPRHLVDKHPILVLLERLQRSGVREFLPAEAVKTGQTGLEKPVRKLVVESLDGHRNELCLGRQDSERNYLMWCSSSVYPGTFLLVDSSTLGLLDRLDPEKLVYNRLAPIDIQKVDKISLKYPGRQLELVADGDTLWRIVKPQEFKARLWEVERLLSTIDTMTALTVLPQSVPGRGFETPQLDLELYHQDSLIGRFLVGNYSGSNIYFRDVGRQMDFVIPPRTLERLSWSYDDLADVPVLQVVQ